MLLLREYPGPAELGDQLRGAHAVTTELMWDVFGEACRRLPSIRQTEKAAHIERLIASEAWTDAALALIDLALPRWQVRRIVYDDGEWYCALSRGRELPDWLDRSIESRHADLALGAPERLRRGPRRRRIIRPPQRADGVPRRQPALRAPLLR